MATIKLKDESTKTFSIDGVCYTKGDYRLQYNAKKEVLIIPKAVANISNLSGLPFKNPTAWTYFVDLNDDPYGSFEEFSLAISDAINFNGAGATAQYKFLLSQTGGDDPQTATSGSLTQGVTYEIVAFETGDDFTPSGAPNNDVGTKWIANNVAPTWSNGSEIGWNGGAPFIYAQISDYTSYPFWFEWNSDGVYNLVKTGDFDNTKTFYNMNFQSNDPSADFTYGARMKLNSGFIVFSSFDTNTPANDIIDKAPVEITIKP